MNSPAREKPRSPVRVQIVSSNGGYQLLRGGVPYTVKGAGMPFDDIANFAAHGGNSIRNWTTVNEYQDTLELLDSAHAHGVTVALGLPMRSERLGFDYDDPAAVAEQLSAMREEVIRYRDHPALLAWIIGNELNLGYTNSRVYDAVGDVAAMIHDLDPLHPATTTVAEVEEKAVIDIRTRAPAIDFISFQVYRKLFSLSEILADIDYRGPFMVTEWGTTGYWEADKTTWGAPIEATSSEKADIFRRGYHECLAKLGPGFIGSYVFLWGQKQERTPTWFGMFMPTGEATEVVDVMHRIWAGAWPASRAPQVRSMVLDGLVANASVTLISGASYEASADIVAPDGEPLSWRWEVTPESDAQQSGGDYEHPVAALDGLIDDVSAEEVLVTAPSPGAYRLFVTARDGRGHAAHANIPFLSVAGEDL